MMLRNGMRRGEGIVEFPDVTIACRHVAAFHAEEADETEVEKAEGDEADCNS